MEQGRRFRGPRRRRGCGRTPSGSGFWSCCARTGCPAPRRRDLAELTAAAGTRLWLVAHQAGIGHEQRAVLDETGAGSAGRGWRVALALLVDPAAAEVEFPAVRDTEFPLFRAAALGRLRGGRCDQQSHRTGCRRAAVAPVTRSPRHRPRAAPRRRRRPLPVPARAAGLLSAVVIERHAQLSAAPSTRSDAVALFAGSTADTPIGSRALQQILDRAAAYAGVTRRLLPVTTATRPASGRTLAPVM